MQDIMEVPKEIQQYHKLVTLIIDILTFKFRLLLHITGDFRFLSITPMKMFFICTHVVSELFIPSPNIVPFQTYAHDTCPVNQIFDMQKFICSINTVFVSFLNFNSM